MTHEDWLAAETPGPLLAFLETRSPGPAERTHYFMAAASARLVWDKLTPSMRQTMTLLESAARAPRDTALPKSSQVVNLLHSILTQDLAGIFQQVLALSETASFTRTRIGFDVTRALGAAPRDQAGIVRDLIGNPFSEVTFEDGWRTELVLRLATTIDREQSYESLPYLADALMDAGCDHSEILTHCRTPAVHHRGCWVLEGLLQTGPDIPTIPRFSLVRPAGDSNTRASDTAPVFG